MSLQIGSPPKRFQSTWDTTQAGSSNNQVVLPLTSHGSASYNFQVDWGDGASNRDTITAYNQAEVTHTYDSTGVYEIRVIGGITGWRFNAAGDVDSGCCECGAVIAYMAGQQRQRGWVRS